MSDALLCGDDDSAGSGCNEDLVDPPAASVDFNDDLGVSVGFSDALGDTAEASDDFLGVVGASDDVLRDLSLSNAPELDFLDAPGAASSIVSASGSSRAAMFSVA